MKFGYKIKYTSEISEIPRWVYSFYSKSLDWWTVSTITGATTLQPWARGLVTWWPRSLAVGSRLLPSLWTKAEPRPCTADVGLLGILLTGILLEHSNTSNASSMQVWIVICMFHVYSLFVLCVLCFPFEYVCCYSLWIVSSVSFLIGFVWVPFFFLFDFFSWSFVFSPRVGKELPFSGVSLFVWPVFFVKTQEFQWCWCSNSWWTNAFRWICFVPNLPIIWGAFLLEWLQPPDRTSPKFANGGRLGSHELSLNPWCHQGRLGFV